MRLEACRRKPGRRSTLTVIAVARVSPSSESSRALEVSQGLRLQVRKGPRKRVVGSKNAEIRRSRNKKEGSKRVQGRCMRSTSVMSTTRTRVHSPRGNLFPRSNIV